VRFLITGGTGFIGQALCQALRAERHDVTVFTRDAARARAGLGSAVACVDRWADIAAADVVINLAGENLADGRWSAARKRAMRYSRIGTTQALIAWMSTLTTPPRLLISGSAIGWYGPRGDEPLDETATAGDDFAARLCRDWETEATQARALGVRVCLLRIGIVLDAHGGALARMLPPFRLGLGGRLGSGRQWMSWISRADIVRLILWLAQRDDAEGVFNATAPTPITNAAFTRALGQALRRPALLPAPAPALRLLLGEMAGLLLTGQRVLPARALREHFEFRHPTLPTALASILGPAG
jgi:uncharacterized protein (TIGR01777 family)